MVSAPMLHLSARLMLGSNASAAKRGLSCSARCSPNSVQAVYWKPSSFCATCLRATARARPGARRSGARRGCWRRSAHARTMRPSSSAIPVARPPSTTMRSMRTCGCERAAGRDERLHQPAREIERAAAAELITALQVEGADHRSHRARLRQRVGQPGAEQRHLEQEQELDVLVLEQLVDHVERLAAGHLEKVAAERGLRVSSASRSACGSGSA